MIEVKNICLSYGQKKIFDNFSYNFELNKVHCIMGKSGCGKTTLLRMIAGLLHPDSGTVSYNGKPIKATDPDIFMMHQKYTNFPWKTCLDNVLFPISLKRKVTETDRKHALEMLEAVELPEYADKYPYELSGGMNQRLALARVLVSDPPIILMDEPLSALDPITRQHMQKLILKEKAEGTKNTVIMITHDPAEAEIMGDNIVRL